MIQRLIVLWMCSLCCALAAAENMFDGQGGTLSRADLFAAISAADVVVLGEVHTDAGGHRWQQNLLRDLVDQNIEFILSVEEFDRSQQGALDEFSDKKINGQALKDIRAFVGPSVRDQWREWYLPQLEIARDGGVSLIASNSPLKYSRMARNVGCTNISDLSDAERALFECPLLPVDLLYQARFYRTMEKVSRSNKKWGMKPLSQLQMSKMFRAHRVWDATMAGSIADARERHKLKLVHIVGSFHSDYNGGLIQELQARASSDRVLVISIRPGRAAQLPVADQQRADILVYKGT